MIEKKPEALLCPAGYKLALTMTLKNLDIFLTLLTSLQRQDPFMRDALPPKTKLEIILSFLGWRMSLLSCLKIISHIILEVYWAT